VRRYPLDKSRYEVMLEVTNTSPDPMDIELSLLGDGALIDLTRLRLDAGERLPRFYPNLSGASRTLEAKLALAGGGADDAARRRSRLRTFARAAPRACPGRHRPATCTSRPRCCSTSTSTSPPSSPRITRRRAASTSPSSTAWRPPPAPGRGSLLYLNPTGTNAPFGVGKVLLDDDADVLGFDELDEKHPILRYTSARRRERLAGHRAQAAGRGQGRRARARRARCSSRGGAAGVKFVALGFDIRESDFALRIAWPLLLLNVINDFVEEDASYISSFVTGRVFQVPAPSTVGPRPACEGAPPTGSERGSCPWRGRARRFPRSTARVFTR
jgi:hypothetical protein